MNDTIKMCLKQYDKLHGKHKQTRTLCIKIELRVSLWRFTFVVAVCPKCFCLFRALRVAFS